MENNFLSGDHKKSQEMRSCKSQECCLINQNIIANERFYLTKPATSAAMQKDVSEFSIEVLECITPSSSSGCVSRQMKSFHKLILIVTGKFSLIRLKTEERMIHLGKNRNLILESYIHITSVHGWKSQVTTKKKKAKQDLLNFCFLIQLQ